MADTVDLTVGISRLHHPVTALGPGRRVGIWFQGCSIGCPGCMSHDTWEPTAPADQVPLTDVTGWVARLPEDEVDGITISGGEPLDQPAALLGLTAWLRDHFGPDRVDLLVYTGYTHQVVRRRHADTLAHVDAVITEPYRRNAAGTALRWRGSPNQRLVPLTRLGGERYGAHVDAPAVDGLQVSVGDGRVRIVGIPRPGDLARIEAGLAARGLTLDDCSWDH